MPDSYGTGLPGQERHVGEHRAHRPQQARTFAHTFAPLKVCLAKVFLHQGVVLIRGLIGCIQRLVVTDRSVSQVGKSYVQPRGGGLLVGVPAAAPAWTDACNVHRTVADVVIGVTGEVFRGKLPVTGHGPFLDAADDFRSAFIAVSGVQQKVQVDFHLAKVFRERRSVFVPGRPDCTLVVFQLGDFYQAPFGLIQLLVVGVLEIWHAHQGAVSGIAPAVVGAGEYRRVALVVPADLHPPVSA